MEWIKQYTFKIIGVTLVIIAFILLYYFLNPTLFKNQFVLLLNSPFWLLTMTFVYGMSFLLKAAAWRIYLRKQVSFLTCFQGIGWSLFINHLTPFKVGDVIRASAIIHKRKISWDEAFHSVFVLRIIDIVTLLLLSSIGFLVFFHRIPINIMLVVGVISIGVVCVAVLVVMKTKSSFILKHITLLRLGLKGWKGAFIITIVSISWMMEGIVLFATLHVIGIDFTFVKAVWVNSVTVGGQVFQVAPGGLGTYESIMSTMLVLSDLSIDQALNIAVYTHSFKFIFSYIIGIYVVVKAPLQWRQILSQRKKGEQMK